MTYHNFIAMMISDYNQISSHVDCGLTLGARCSCMHVVSVSSYLPGIQGL